LNELDRFERAIVLGAIWAPGAVSEFIAKQDLSLLERIWTADSALSLLLGMVAIELINWRRRKRSKPSYPTALSAIPGKNLTDDLQRASQSLEASGRLFGARPEYPLRASTHPSIWERLRRKVCPTRPAAYSQSVLGGNQDRLDLRLEEKNVGHHLTVALQCTKGALGANRISSYPTMPRRFSF
jgi:hypothetical protein